MTVNLEKLTKPFPPDAIKSRQGAGRRMYEYVPTHLIIRRLNDATDSNWDWRIVKIERHGDLLMCYGELTIPGHGTRTGIGVQQVSPGGGEDLAKGVSSDALKKAATLFGVALELYGPDVEGDDAEPPAQTYPHDTHYSRQPDAPHTADNTFLASPALMETLAQTAKDSGWDKGTLMAYMLETYGKGWSRTLTIAQANAAIDHIAAQRPADMRQPALA